MEQPGKLWQFGCTLSPFRNVHLGFAKNLTMIAFRLYSIKVLPKKHYVITHVHLHILTQFFMAGTGTYPYSLIKRRFKRGPGSPNILTFPVPEKDISGDPLALSRCHLKPNGTVSIGSSLGGGSPKTVEKRVEN